MSDICAAAPAATTRALDGRGPDRLTIRDVAAVANVSVKTVSRVLNKHRYVNADTRARVEAAVQQLGFRPSIAARALAGTRSGQIALLYDNHSPHYIHQVQAGAWSRCQTAGIRLLAQPVDVGDPLVGDMVHGLIAETHVDGIILSSPVTDCPAVLAALEARGLNFVRISPGTNHALTSSVYMDDAQAADDMTSHLLNLGHRRIGFVIGHPNHMASNERLFGYRRALDRAGVDYEPTLVRPGTFDFDSGLAAGRALLALPLAPTAIFASNDDMAAGVLTAAHRAGVSVPDTLSVAGFDDTTLARMVWPPLTTIRQPVLDLAFTAADLLLRGAGVIEHLRLPHDLVVRDSTAPPPV